MPKDIKKVVEKLIFEANGIVDQEQEQSVADDVLATISDILASGSGTNMLGIKWARDEVNKALTKLVSDEEKRAFMKMLLHSYATDEGWEASEIDDIATKLGYKLNPSPFTSTNIDIVDKQGESVDQEQEQSVADDVLDTIAATLSSGTAGTDILGTNWGKEAIDEALAKLTSDEEKRAFMALLLNALMDDEGWEADEINYIAAKLGYKVNSPTFEQL